MRKVADVACQLNSTSHCSRCVERHDLSISPLYLFNYSYGNKKLAAARMQVNMLNVLTMLANLQLEMSKLLLERPPQLTSLNACKEGGLYTIGTATSQSVSLCDVCL